MLAFEHLATGFSALNLRSCAAASALAYRPVEEQQTQCLSWGFNRFKFIENETSGAKLFVAGNDRMILVACCGTDSIQDWISDLDFELVTVLGMRIHAGAYDQLHSIWDELDHTLAAFSNRAQRVWFTGHSLGGMLAALAALLQIKIARRRAVAGGYTFGQPRVGDAEFARQFDAALKPVWFRAVEQEDVVPRLPRLALALPPTFFHQAGTEIFFDALGVTHFDLPWWRKLPSDVLGLYREWRQGRVALLADHAVAKYLERGNAL